MSTKFFTNRNSNTLTEQITLDEQQENLHKQIAALDNRIDSRADLWLILSNYQNSMRDINTFIEKDDNDYVAFVTKGRIVEERKNII